MDIEPVLAGGTIREEGVVGVCLSGIVPTAVHALHPVAFMLGRVSCDFRPPLLASY